jgi:hypothetical protein
LLRLRPHAKPDGTVVGRLSRDLVTPLDELMGERVRQWDVVATNDYSDAQRGQDAIGTDVGLCGRRSPCLQVFDFTLNSGRDGPFPLGRCYEFGKRLEPARLSLR